MSKWRAAQGQPGEVVTALVSNPLENSASRGKLRPVILVRRDGSRWHVMGLTTKPIYRSGAPRQPVPNPLCVGLNRPGYLWANRLTGVSVLDIEGHLGWVDLALATAVITQAHLGPADSRALLEATQEREAA